MILHMLLMRVVSQQSSHPDMAFVVPFWLGISSFVKEGGGGGGGAQQGNNTNGGGSSAWF